MLIESLACPLSRVTTLLIAMATLAAAAAAAAEAVPTGRMRTGIRGQQVQMAVLLSSVGGFSL